MTPGRCYQCDPPLLYVHGHGQCDRHGCHVRGLNQEPCCQP